MKKMEKNVYILDIGFPFCVKSIFLWDFHFVCECGHLPIVKYLISKNANIKSKDSIGNTPLHSAASMDHKDIVEFLLANGANKETRNNKQGWNPIWPCMWQCKEFT